MPTATPMAAPTPPIPKMILSFSFEPSFCGLSGRHNYAKNVFYKRSRPRLSGRQTFLNNGMVPVTAAFTEKREKSA
jgi:hypothetical protein